MQEDKKDRPHMRTLFRGQSDRAYLFGKLEKLAHAVMTLTTRSDSTHPIIERLEHAVLDSIAEASGGASGGDQGLLVARLLELVSLIRLSSTAHLIAAQNAELLAEEYLQVLTRLSHPSLQGMLLNREDLMNEEEAVAEQTMLLPRSLGELFDVSSVSAPAPRAPQASTQGGRKLPAPKGQKNVRNMSDRKDPAASERSQRILTVVKAKGVVSIRDVAGVITDCSEKTIQRELLALVDLGVLKKQGERRWSTYRLA